MNSYKAYTVHFYVTHTHLAVSLLQLYLVCLDLGFMRYNRIIIIIMSYWSWFYNSIALVNTRSVGRRCVCVCVCVCVCNAMITTMITTPDDY